MLVADLSQEIQIGLFKMAKYSLVGKKFVFRLTFYLKVHRHRTIYKYIHICNYVGKLLSYVMHDFCNRANIMNNNNEK